jgi:hypothetical protein
VILAAGLAACGSEGTVVPTGFEGERTTEVLFTQSLENVEAGSQRSIHFSLPRRGTLSLSVRWNDQANSVVAVLLGTECVSLQRRSEECPERRGIEGRGREGREVVVGQTNAGGDYELVVQNEGPGTESIRVTAELTSFVPSASPSATPSPAGSGAAEARRGRR